MKNFLKTFFIFIYIFLLLFIKPCEVLACNDGDLNNTPAVSITQAQKTVNTFDEKEHYYAILQHNNNAQISNNNKNNDPGLILFNTAILKNNFFNRIFIDKNKIYYFNVIQKLFRNLKNTIRVRAP